MKYGKKISALLLAFCLMAFGAVPAFAAGKLGDVSYADDPFVVITKVYKLEGAGTSPAETFTLQQVGAGLVKDGEAKTAPALGTITGAAFEKGAASENGAEAQITVELPVYERVGVYEYVLREVAGTTAGVTYYGKDIRLVVTVINDEETGKLRVAAVHTESVGEEKRDSFPNTYAAGTLSITKTVTGNLGDKTEYFPFIVTLTGEAGKTYGEAYAVTGGSYEENPAVIQIGEPTTFYLKHEDTLSIANLPYGVKYTVEEDTPEDYTVAMDQNTGFIEAASVTASFTNNKGGTPDTGITLDSLPYLILFGLAAAGSLVLIGKKHSIKKD